MFSSGLAMQGSLCLALLGTIMAKLWGCSQRGAQGTSRSLGGIDQWGGKGDAAFPHPSVHPLLVWLALMGSAQ